MHTHRSSYTPQNCESYKRVSLFHSYTPKMKDSSSLKFEPIKLELANGNFLIANSRERSLFIKGDCSLVLPSPS